MLGIALMAVVLVGVVTFALTQGQDQSEAGMGIPTENLVDEPYDDAQAIAGAMEVAANGCFHLRTADEQLFVVWPDGFEHDSDAAKAPDGTRYVDGDEIDGIGWIRDADDVVRDADGPDGYLDMVLGYCAPDGERVAVLQSVDG